MPVLPKKLGTPASAAAVLVAALWLAYGSDAGHGFIKDDFRWIRETRVSSLADLARLFDRTDGFYRPLVSLTFAFNSSTSDVAPRPYGLTNLALVLIDAALVWLLARRLGLGTGPALLAAGVWAFNFHGINMAVLWISGRTALLVATCALLGALAFLAGRVWLAAICCLLAMLSKEEAVLLPALLVAWAACDSRGSLGTRSVAAIRRWWPCFAALAVYLLLRLRTDAFWLAGAPSYYRLTFTPDMVAANILQYADRAITWPAFAGLVVYASARFPRLDDVERRAVVFGVLWLIFTFAITIFVPTRSSLYAVLPSVGSALAAAAAASAALRAVPRRASIALTALALMPLLALPIYWRRNERWVRLADLSTSVLQTVRATGERAPGRPIVIRDNASERFNLDAAFGSLWPDAAALCLPPGIQSTITQDDAPPNGIVLRLENGRLIQED